MASPSISLPKGGGAIHGIGEKFAANPVTGTGSMTVPIAVSPGRSGFGPQLSLAYDSGSGNGPFGFGWALSLPQITRKTDKGLPQYRDANESDVFLISGAEDLVPVFAKDEQGRWKREAGGAFVLDENDRDGHRVRRYRPRIEGLFARIERWTRQADGDTHWRSIDKNNVVTVYGRDSNARIADPDDPSRVFAWLISDTRDDKGNGIAYDYKADDGVGLDLGQVHERNRGERDDPRRSANCYLKRIRYGNRVPLLDGSGRRPHQVTAAALQNADWMFEVVFDYGEHDAEAPQPSDNPAHGNSRPWPARPDRFSSFRSGFELRTNRLCRRVLMFHHFPGEPEVGADCLVSSTDLAYSFEENPADVSNPVYSFLLSVTRTGYRRDDTGRYRARSWPPVEFTYETPTVQPEVRDIDTDSLANLPAGLDDATWQFTDLHGEGLPGFLTEQGGELFYKRNLSPLHEKRVELAPLERVALRPNLSIAGARAQFMDLAGDGLPDLVVLGGAMAGFYEHDEAEGWQPFRPFANPLHRQEHDPNLRFIDLDGDGRPDALISEDDFLVWHNSLAEEGFGPARRVPRACDEEEGPRLVFADSTQSIHLADMTGDGLMDLVRIRPGEVCYWSNRGFGAWGKKTTMDASPHFDHPDQFDPRRIRLVDADCSGTTDLLYLHREGVHLYANRCGNAWSPPLGACRT